MNIEETEIEQQQEQENNESYIEIITFNQRVYKKK